MAIPFLNNIDLSDNQLLNAKLQVTSPAPTAAAGQIYYNSISNTAQYYNGTAWVELVASTGGTVTSVTSGNTNTITIGGTATDPTISANTAAVTNGSLNLATGDQIYDFVIGQGYVESVSSNNSTFVNLVDSGTATGPNLTASLSANGTASSSTYLRGDNTWAALPGDPTITLTGEVIGGGTTLIATTVANNVLDVANFNATAIVTAAEGIENNNNDTTLPTSAAVKAYVDAATVGGLVYQGGYNAATNTPNLDVTPISGIKKGWTYTVTADGLFFTEQVRVGDVLIAEIDSPTTLADWTTVQNNIDIASASQIGIGNVAVNGLGNKDGLSLVYASGTATVGLDINSLPSFTGIISSIDTASLEIPLYNMDNADANEKFIIQDLIDIVNKYNTYATTISATAPITHLLGRDVIIQLYDTVTFETVYADVDRISTTQATITFATTPTNPIKVLVQKIG